MKRPAAAREKTGLGVRLLPTLITFFMALIMLLPLGNGLSGQNMPHLVLISCFYWLSSRPLLMPYVACALIGLLLDLWLGVPLGLNMAMLLLARLFVLNQLKHYRGKSRVVYWGVFSIMALLLFAGAWLVSSIVDGKLANIDTVFVQWLVTSFFYAPVAFVLGNIRRWAM